MADAVKQIAGLLSGLGQPGLLNQPRTLADLASYYPVPQPQPAYSGSVLPFSRDVFGNTSFDSNAGLLGGIKRAFTAPGDAYAGRLPMWGDDGHTSLDAIGRATDLAGLLTLGSGMIPAEGGAVLNAGLSGLRQRYAPYLSAASGGKDPARIKLTPERVDAAKELRRTGFGMYPEGRPIDPIGSGPSPYRTTEQAQQAARFAAQARQAVDDVRVKFPEGPNGSVYVRVGDNGTVRFADHPPPMDNGKTVGGYSRALGRRHQPATVDVSSAQRGVPLNAQPAYDFLSALLRGDGV